MRVPLYFLIFLTVYFGAITELRIMREGDPKQLGSSTTPEKLKEEIIADPQCPAGIKERLAIISFGAANVVERYISLRDIEVGNKKILALLEGTPSEEFGTQARSEQSPTAAGPGVGESDESEGGEVQNEKARQDFIAKWHLVQWQSSRFFGIEQFISYAILVYGLARLGTRSDQLGRIRKDDNRLVNELQPDQAAGAPLTVKGAQGLVQRLKQLEQQTKKSVLREVLEALLNSFLRTRDTGAALNLAQVSLHEGLEPYHFTTERTALFLSLLPTVGFIGTVRGLGEALGFANSSQNLPQVVGGLSIAFDATLVALLCWLALRLRLSGYEQGVVAVNSEIVKNMNVYAERLKSEATLADQVVKIDRTYRESIAAFTQLLEDMKEFRRQFEGDRGDPTDGEEEEKKEEDRKQEDEEDKGDKTDGGT